MWNIGSFSHHMPVGPQRQYSTRPIEKMGFMPEYLKKGTSFPTNFGTHQINIEKKFVNPNFVNKVADKRTSSHGDIYEKCSTFINNSNGYPNNARKDHISPVDLQLEVNVNKHIEPSTSYPISIDIKTSIISKVKPKYNNKKGRLRKNWQNQAFSMELLDIDEIGIDVCNDTRYLQNDSMENPKFMAQTNSTSDDCLDTSPIGCIGRQILKTLSSSPICIKLQTPVFFSISPPHAMGIAISDKICEGFRRRLPSDCASEDSFIMFEEDSEDDVSMSEDECSDTAEESDGDIVDCHVDNCLNDTTTKTDMDDLKSARKVHFADPKDLLEVHPMIKWSFAYQAARKGHWELYARDRERFKNRITQSSNILSRILNFDHRQYIYDTRFRDDDVNAANQKVLCN